MRALLGLIALSLALDMRPGLVSRRLMARRAAAE